MSRYKSALSRIKSFKVDKFHIILVLCVLFSVYLNISLYVTNMQLQGDVEVHSIDEIEMLSPKPAEVQESTKLGVMTFTTRPGDTLYKIFNDAGIDPADSGAIVAAVDKVHHASQLKIGQKVEIDFTDNAGGEYYSKIKHIDILADEFTIEVNYDLQEKQYTAKLITIPIAEEYGLMKGEINESLYADALKAGASPGIILDLIQKFSYDVDFQRDIKPGDKFNVYYNFYVTEHGKKLRDGSIKYAALELSGKKLEIFKYTYNNTVEYFDRSGNSVRKALLKTPVNGAKITSKFGNRKHPILGFSKMHKGLDYGTPAGAPIFAAGDGVVEFTKYNKNGYGKYIKIKHTQKYSTLYAHLSKFANKMGKGVRVSQGDIIGYVGSTGLATGPHLHYEVHENGVQVNPAKISVAKIPSLQGNELKNFKAFVKEMDEKVA